MAKDNQDFVREAEAVFLDGARIQPAHLRCPRTGENGVAVIVIAPDEKPIVSTTWRVADARKLALDILIMAEEAESRNAKGEWQ